MGVRETSGQFLWGGGVGKLFKIGNQSINSRTEAYYNVEKPDGVPDWQWGLTVQFLFPK